ncbi:HAMP domain-containing sensor histidine kinase [Archangium primigenium]|uniref:HAMP domain-containing sensor histidine kinase n=1 Tax=[Archangium] primigenium TaxID=2792470 RepID=UPI00195A9CFB|nr:HAMP domain-containing sensor histidine kinase [Archangium primigenium]MBM7112869.1 HAMP domain-containing histidine kinase [Archangium primigenium]
MSLKWVITAAVALLAALSLAAASALIVLTTYLHRTTVKMGEAVEGVRAAEDFEVSLLTFHRLQASRRRGEPVVESQVRAAESTLLLQLEKALGESQSEEEQALLASVQTTFNAYLAAQSRAPDNTPPGMTNLELNTRLEATLTPLNHLIALNINEARADQAEADRWDQMANEVGVGVAFLLVLGGGVLLVWMRRSVFRPLLGLSRAIHRYGTGDRALRAPLEGPTELCEMARTFNEMADTLDHQRDAQLAFLAGVAHDLRNPLSALRMSAALVTSGRVTEERMQKTMGLVRRQVSRLDRMVGDLLDATRIEAGRFELSLEDRDVRELVASVVELYESGGGSRELRLVMPEEPVRLRCDATRVEQVLHNLVSNALKYSPESSGVEVQVRHEGDEAWLCVVDQGIGISPEELTGLFAPFQRTGRAREKAPGVGIGLSVARRIVEAHGGRIEVESQPGRGSTFRVRLPLSRAEQDTPEPEAKPEPPDPSGSVH